MAENPPRLSFLEYGAFMAFAASCRATCRRKIVGCVLFNIHKVIVSTGYNGAPAGAPQCDEDECLMVNGHCERITHAEKNAVLFAGKRCPKRGGYAFATTRPCQRCFDILVSKEIKHIYYLEEYRSEEFDREQRRICAEKEITLEKLDTNIVEIMQKAIKFHQGPGGLLTMKHPLRIEEQFPTDWNE